MDKCSECEDHFCTSKLLRSHFNSKHRKLSCERCGQTFTLKKSLDHHVKIRSDVSCSECGKLFCNLNSVNIHKNEVHDFMAYGNFAPATAFPCTKITFWGFYFCSHFLSSGRNILRFDMQIIQQSRRNWFKTVEIWNTQVICYFSAQTFGWQAEFELKNKKWEQK